MNKIALFALNGIGTLTLQALLRADCNVVSLRTRAEPGPHPYFACDDIREVAEAAGIPVFYDNEDIEDPVDLILAATYHKMITAAQRAKATAAINLHPSLLPKHAGRNPFKSVIAAGEIFSGVTAHHMTDKFDDGEIIDQWRCISSLMAEPELRQKLGELTAKMAVDIAEKKTRKALK